MKAKQYTGTALEIGQEVCLDVCIPLIQECAQSMTDEQLAHLYAGVLSTLLGAMSADFGADGAIDLMDTLADSFREQAHSLTTPHTVQ